MPDARGVAAMLAMDVKLKWERLSANALGE
jgi:hypothetical protein